MVESVAGVLKREHRDIDNAIEIFAAGAAGAERQDLEPLRHAISVLRRHIYVEEEHVFPLLREAELASLLLLMLREHGAIWDDLERLERELDADAAAMPYLCHKLLIRLQHHNVKEEEIIYPRAAVLLSGFEAAELVSFLNRGELPAGWNCARASTAR